MLIPAAWKQAASKVKTVPVIVEQVSVETPLFISNFLKPWDKVTLFHKLWNRMFKWDQWLPKAGSEEVDDFYKHNQIHIYFFSLGNGTIKIKMRTQFSKHVEFLNKGLFVLVCWGPFSLNSSGTTVEKTPWVGNSGSLSQHWGRSTQCRIGLLGLVLATRYVLAHNPITSVMR